YALGASRKLPAHRLQRVADFVHGFDQPLFGHSESLAPVFHFIILAHIDAAAVRTAFLRAIVGHIEFSLPPSAQLTLRKDSYFRAAWLDRTRRMCGRSPANAGSCGRGRHAPRALSQHCLASDKS